MTLLDLDGVVSGYGDVTVVDGVDMAVEEGEMVTVIGPNGAGKSTLLKTVVGVVPTFAGTITFEGRDITETPPSAVIDEGICFVPQTENVFPNLTVRENLRMGAWSAPEAVYDERVAEVYDHFPDLVDREDQLVGNLSGGQQQMVAIGAALMVDPDLLILDEPSAGLAPKLIDTIFEKVAAINDAGTTVLMVEQNARRALRESDRGVVLDMGEDRFEGSGEELLDSEEIADLYLGAS